MSGNRWPAGLKRRPWRLDESKSGYDHAIDRYAGKFGWQRRRLRGQPARHRGRGHADRAEIVGMAVVGMALLLAVVRRGDGRRHCGNAAPGNLAVDRVDVTKGQ